MSNPLMTRTCWLALLLLIAVTACHDDHDEPVAGRNWDVAWSDDKSEATIDIYGRYYSLYTNLVGEADSTLTLTCDADWLQLQHATLPADGIIQVLAQANEGGAGRMADIIVSSSRHPEQQVTLHIRQRGVSEDRENDENTDIMSDYRVGWGFNAFEEYKSLTSQRGRIIDPLKLARFDSDTTFKSVQEAVRAAEAFQVFSAWSVQEMSMKLTKEMTAQVNVVFVKKTVKRFSEVNKNTSRESACSYARLQKTVATRSMDEGALRYIIGEKQGDELPFTDGFRKAYERVMSSRGTEREAAVRDMIDTYGTHLIISASVGCKMDLCLTFEKSTSYEFRREVEETSKKVFGRTKKSRTEKVSEHLSCDLSNSNSIQVSGGSAELRSRLESSIRTLTDINVLEGDLVTAWLASVSTADLYDAQRRKDLDVVDFRFMPIWDLFSDVEAKAAVLTYVIDMSHRSDCDFNDRELGMDNYKIDLTDKSLANFSTAQNASLVRVARLDNGTPLVEVCQEYVPKVRSDKRIVVYYPILEGRTRIEQGIFRGDGEMSPCTLTFSDDDVYVDPIDGYGTGDILNTLYYVHGNLYAEDFGIAMQQRALTTTNEVFRVKNVSIPIVKIGAGYWTRRNMNESLQFGRPKDPNKLDGDYYIEELFRDNMLYTNVFYGNSSAFRKNYPGLFDDEKDIQSGQAIHWYLPMPKDISYLKSYIGKNTKSLFRGQVSGFDAQFAGCWGRYDILKNNAERTSEGYQYVNEYCFVPAKQTQYSGSVIVLGKDYTTRLIDIDSGKADWYPVRAFRTSYYTYK